MSLKILFYVDSNYRTSLVVLRVDIGLFLFIIGKKTCYLAEYKAIYLRKIPCIWCVEFRKYIATYFTVNRHACFSSHNESRFLYLPASWLYTVDFLSQCTYTEYFEAFAYHYTSSIMCKKHYFGIPRYLYLQGYISMICSYIA